MRRQVWDTSAKAPAEHRKNLAGANFVLALDAVKTRVFNIDTQLRNRANTHDRRLSLQKSATERGAGR